MDLFPKDEPSGCVISDSCNFLLALGDPTIEDRFVEFETHEDFASIMADVVQAFAVVNDNTEILQTTLEVNELVDILHAMKVINEEASETLRQRNY
tara:strand:+ start:207 stop:494 length:288 start_codon:yes stop_codon:yes gene_type:complete